MILISFPGCKTVHTELIVPAEPREVWAVLSDGPGYKEWNPVLVPVEGELREGAKLKYSMTDGTGKKSIVSARVVRMIPERKLNQFGGIPGILTFDHTWSLKPVKGGTLVVQHEEYRGIWVPFWDASWVEPAYKKANEALRERVRKLKK